MFRLRPLTNLSTARRGLQIGFARRFESSVASDPAKPYSLPPSITALTPIPSNLKTNGNVMARVQEQQLYQLDPTGWRTALFKRSSPTCVPIGSVLLVETHTSLAPNTSPNPNSGFLGVLISVYRRGIDTSFTLRNIVMKVGVEQRFKLYSPMIKNIRVLQKPRRRYRRAKLFFLRNQPGKVFRSLDDLWKKEVVEKARKS